jgi:hypothetical protein
MTEQEVALELLKIIRGADPQAAGLMDKAKLLALYRECLAAVRGNAE